MACPRPLLTWCSGAFVVDGQPLAVMPLECWRMGLARVALWRVTMLLAASPLSSNLVCSAIKSVVMVNPANPMRASSKGACLNLQLLHKFGHRADFHAGLAPAGLAGLEHLET